MSVYTRNECLFMGRVRSAPDLRVTTTGKTWAKFPLEVEQGPNKPVMVLEVSCWEEVARQMKEQVRAGSVVQVQGRLTYRLYQGRSYYDVVADTVEWIAESEPGVAPDPWQGEDVVF